MNDGAAWALVHALEKVVEKLDRGLERVRATEVDLERIATALESINERMAIGLTIEDEAS